MRYTTLLVILLTIFALFYAPESSAHPGRTAADGCHYCRTNCDSWGVSWNERHCHGGGSSGGSGNSVPVQSDSVQSAPVVQQPVVKRIYPTATPKPTLTPIPTKAPYVETENDKKKLFKVVSIIDGEIDVSIRGKIERVRLLAIDTPETKDPRKPVQCFGVEATKKLQSLVEGKYVKLVDDRSQGNRDK